MTRRGRIRLAAVVLLLLLGLAFFFRSEATDAIEPGSTLLLTVGGAYAEAPKDSALAKILGEGREPFLDLLSTLNLARRDDRLDVVVVRLRDLQVGWGKAQEIRNALGRVRDAGRRVVVVLETQGLSANGEYYVASVADEIYATPGSVAPVLGLSAEAYFLGGLFEKLGLEWDVAQAGRYKSAVETYTQTHFSESARENLESMLDSFNAQFLTGIAQGRGWTVDEVREAIDRGPLLPTELEALGLIDGVRHVDEVLCDCDEPEKLVHGKSYRNMDPAALGFEAVSQYAILYGSGAVVSGSASMTPMGAPVFASRTFTAAVDEAAEREDIDALILRIDSPGGSAMASEEIWYAVRKARRHGKPIVASFSDVAASGGYYVAVAADAIVSSPGTVTGSIGVFALRPILKPVLDEIGISVQTFTRGRYANCQFTLERPSEECQARLQHTVLDIYGLFLDRVSEGRSLELAEVDAVGQGRVWTGEQAFEIGLVDELGGLDAAVKRINRMRGLEEEADALLVPYPRPQSLGEQLADLFQVRAIAALRSLWPVALPESVAPFHAWLAGWSSEGPLLVPPVWVEVK